MDDKPISDIEINLLEPNPLQARAIFSAESLAELSSSIKEHGILEPLVVAKTPAGYQIIAGERRWRAAKMAGLTRVPVVVKETTSRGMLEMALVENVQREDLNPVDRAQAFQRLVEEFGLPVSEIARRISKSDAYVSNTIRLLALPDAIKDGLISGATTEGHARAISGLGNTKLMVDAYKTLLAENASVRRAEELVRQIRSKMPNPPRTSTVRIHTDELSKIEKDMIVAIGGNTKVKVTQSKASARIVIIITEKLEKSTEILRHIHKKLTA
ncbi:MAG: ParB/RepB/Spo0J family partition protein [Candidatus Gottesmanbacteria bacterium]